MGRFSGEYGWERVGRSGFGAAKKKQMRYIRTLISGYGVLSCVCVCTIMGMGMGMGIHSIH